ncbi:MW1434 family type I TA system toxin [Sellimonas catena]|uniref:Thoeris anti-defense 2-like domain-containing protein n=1 Tax=Sellimonas catena TaxID=2994035 RepID=A0A9W6CBJ0_9FIRM|nr:MW1434 family type I TA system toxin [Sellimonas catena]GLG90436.1 hypothetical protein Selli2_18630 [Sellimonas catena]
MYIHEAVMKAMRDNALIIRASARETESDIYSAIRPTNSYDTCLLLVMKGERIDRACRWWNPTADDLMADDWTVIKKEV